MMEDFVEDVEDDEDDVLTTKLAMYDDDEDMDGE